MLESPPHPFSLKLFAPLRKVMCVCVCVCVCVVCVCVCACTCLCVCVCVDAQISVGWSANVQSSYYRCVIKLCLIVP